MIWTPGLLLETPLVLETRLLLEDIRYIVCTPYTLRNDTLQYMK